MKEYARSSADQEEPLPHDLRPVHVLAMTMNHLLHNVADFCELSDDNLEEWYMFMWDRTRAVRKVNITAILIQYIKHKYFVILNLYLYYISGTYSTSSLL